VVFTFEAGGLVSHANWYRSHCRPAVKRAGLPDDVRYHDLRHTYARLLIAEGAHPRAIMERLGHSSIQVTLGTYGHLFPTLDEALTEQGPQAHDFSRGSFLKERLLSCERRPFGPTPRSRDGGHNEGRDEL
jgi:site-specific recombinase XerD